MSARAYRGLLVCTRVYSLLVQSKRPGAVVGVEVSSSERLRRADELDLEPIAYKLMHPDLDAAGVSLAAVEHDIALYRCFLKICVLHPEASIVPSKEIDAVWHAHLLDTSKYRADCEFVFGRFMDHFPYAGMRGADDRAAWREGFARTRLLFKKHFGVEVGAEPAASVCRNHGDGSECCVDTAGPRTGNVRPRLLRV